ncbi:hypothetical protein OIU85_004853 [Salix viminalis]|uniref:Uncharacterized protein n=1 Tax=Salix viminalis TaxID=40686 RepID=A0A9Q0SYL1_SALVM|nr:hypothetical protein OIU85_004853 [Salix viminalis]
MHHHSTMQVVTYILAIMLFFGGFGPGARTCNAVRYISKMEHSRMGLQLVRPEFQQRRIPRPRVFPPVANRERSQGAPPRTPPGTTN